MALIGYARTSSATQREDLQLDALEAAGVDRVFVDHAISGKTLDRPALIEALAYLRDGDVLLIWKMDRLARNVIGVLTTIQELGDRGIGVRSITEPSVDTTTPAGRLLLTLLAAVGSMEREQLVERTVAGIAAARARGAQFGRPRALTPVQVEQVQLMHKRGMGVSAAATAMGVSRATIYRALALAT